MPKRTMRDMPVDQVNRSSGLLGRLEKIEADITALRVELYAKDDLNPEVGVDPSQAAAADVQPGYTFLNQILLRLASGESSSEVVAAYLHPIGLHLDRFVLFRRTQDSFVVQVSQGFGKKVGKRLRLQDPDDPMLRCVDERRLLYFEWNRSDSMPSWVREHGEPNRWCICIPFIFQEATPIVLYGDRASPIQVDLLEFLTHLTVLVLKNQRLQNLVGAAATIEDLPHGEPAEDKPDSAGTDLVSAQTESASEADPAKRQHREAARLARLLISEIQIYQEDQIEKGRLNRDLYLRLKADLERNREVYQTQVHPTVAGRFDYFHQETVRLLAQGDETLLGSEYPGQLLVSSQTPSGS